MDHWTIIRWHDETAHGYISLLTGDKPLNPDIDIELENEEGDTDIIEAGSFEVIFTMMSEEAADDFIGMSVERQDKFVEEYA